MRYLTQSFVAACCLLCVPTTKADIIILKNGERIVGSLLREDGDNYVVDVKITATIHDEKLVPRADVLRIERKPEDEKSFAQIADLFPTPELLSEEGYAERIGKIEGFLKDHPESYMAGKAKDMMKSLNEELAIIAAGGIKFGEAIISADEYAANAYEYDARIAEKKIRDAVSRRDMLGALRQFDGYETSFGEPEGRVGLAALMLQVLGTYSASIAESLASLDSRVAARESGLTRMSPDDRVKSQRALDAELEQLTERFQEEKSTSMKWITPHAYHKESLEEAQRQAAAEITRLDKREPAPETPLAELYRTAWKKLQGGTDEEKKAVLDDAKAKRLPETYLAKLRERGGLPQE